MSIKEGDRVQTIDSKEGTVEFLGHDGNMAYVQMDENPTPGDYLLYEVDRLTKIDGEEILRATKL
jgi:hypothetical protein